MSAEQRKEESADGTFNKKKNQKSRFRYGNYNQYYGSRNKGFDRDPRLDFLPIDWFRKRSILDIGCNVGHLTLSIAKEYEPYRILGIDIDEHLIGAARKNIKHYCTDEKVIGNFPASIAEHQKRPLQNEKIHRHTKIIFNDECVGEPSSSSSTSQNPFNTSQSSDDEKKFPKNVWFVRENYVLECDEFLEMVHEEFDVILALSITKWIHLNWGDAGIRRFFRRAFLQLRPGGRLVLEIQDFSSYYKRAKKLPELLENYKSIKMKPESFQEFLIEDVGFEKFEELGTPRGSSKGYERPMLVFTKECFKQKIVPRMLKVNADVKHELDSGTPFKQIEDNSKDIEISYCQMSDSDAAYKKKEERADNPDNLIDALKGTNPEFVNEEGSQERPRKRKCKRSLVIPHNTEEIIISPLK